jgi:hypothetical protein
MYVCVIWLLASPRKAASLFFHKDYGSAPSCRCLTGLHHARGLRCSSTRTTSASHPAVIYLAVLPRLALPCIASSGIISQGIFALVTKIMACSSAPPLGHRLSFTIFTEPFPPWDLASLCPGLFCHCSIVLSCARLLPSLSAQCAFVRPVSQLGRIPLLMCAKTLYRLCAYLRYLALCYTILSEPLALCGILCISPISF